MIVESVAGAGGTIGVNKAAKAAPDSYTPIFTHMGTLAVNIALYKSLGCGLAWSAQEPKAMRDSGGRLCAPAEADASAAAAMSWARVRRVKMEATEMTGFHV